MRLGQYPQAKSKVFPSPFLPLPLAAAHLLGVIALRLTPALSHWLLSLPWIFKCASKKDFDFYAAAAERRPQQQQGRERGAAGARQRKGLLLTPRLRLIESLLFPLSFFILYSV